MKKKLLAALLTVCFCLSISVPAFAVSTPVYNPILEEIGITEEAFFSMPAETRMYYQDVYEITSSETTTRYYKSVCELDSSGSLVQNLIEVSKEIYDVGVATMPMNQIDDDQTTGGWYVMSTTAAEMAVTGGDLHYYVANKLTIDQQGMGILNLDRTGYIGVSLNANWSPVSGSEVMTREFSYITDPNRRVSDTVTKAPHKGVGYAFDFGVTNMIRDVEITMTFVAVPNTNVANVFDAYGFAGYWKNTVTPTISIGAGGADISISPSKDLVKANNTHAQIYI